MTSSTETKKATVCVSCSKRETGNETPKIKEGGAYLEIVEEEGEFMPRAVQARDTSADGRRRLTRLGVGYSHPPNYHEQGHDKGGDLLTQSVGVLVNAKRPSGCTRTIELPTQIPIVSSILSFIAIHTEVTCSAALACTTSQGQVPKGSMGHTHDNGKENKTDERLWDMEPRCCLLDRCDH